jgi:hypothetical protein
MGSYARIHHPNSLDILREASSWAKARRRRLPNVSGMSLITPCFCQRKAAEKAEKPARKSKKDPNAPKRALSAYMFFSQDWRERIKTENPDAGFGKPLPRSLFQCNSY